MENVTPLRRFFRFSSTVLLALVVGACSSPPVPVDTFYNLNTSGNSVSAVTARLGGNLEVSRFRAEGVVNGRAIIYRSSAIEQRQYSYHYWAEPPAVMFQRSFIDALRNSKLFDSVAGPEMRAGRDYELIGTLRRLEHVIGGGSPRVLVEVDVSLRRVSGGQTLLVKTYVKERLAGSSVVAGVESISIVLGQIIEEVVRDAVAAG
ncbi:MAG: ABC-type transport auxiliary lipoprotein family protein [Rhodospirillaceae bacterium]